MNSVMLLLMLSVAVNCALLILMLKVCMVVFFLFFFNYPYGLRKVLSVIKLVLLIKAENACVTCVNACVRLFV